MPPTDTFAKDLLGASLCIFGLALALRGNDTGWRVERGYEFMCGKQSGYMSYRPARRVMMANATRCTLKPVIIISTG